MCIEVNIDQTKNYGALIYRQNYFSATHNNLVESTDQTLWHSIAGHQREGVHYPTHTLPMDCCSVFLQFSVDFKNYC